MWPLPPPAKKPRRVRKSLCLPKSICFIHSRSSSSSPLTDSTGVIVHQQFKSLPSSSSFSSSSSPSAAMASSSSSTSSDFRRRRVGLGAAVHPHHCRERRQQETSQPPKRKTQVTFSFLKEQLTTKFQFHPFSTHHHYVKGGSGDIF